MPVPAAHPGDSEVGPTLQNWRPYQSVVAGKNLRPCAIVDCGWGRLIFAHTFPRAERLIAELLKEGPGARDIAFYIRDPHVLLALAPFELFLDPSHTYRLDLALPLAVAETPGYRIRAVASPADAMGMNHVWMRCHMVPASPEFVMANVDSPVLRYYVAVDDQSGTVIGAVAGVDHVASFDDPENGCSLWSLAVDPQAVHPGVGEMLVRRLALDFRDRGRAYMDLSVMHDNAQAIALYEKLGFTRVPVFSVKRKNPINEPLFVGDSPDEDMNPYARIIVDEARRRGIAVEIVDASRGFFRLRHGGRAILCRESLSALTPATTMSPCDDKIATRHVLAAAGLRVPDQTQATGGAEDAEFLSRHRRVVVKPARGEQGRGVFVDLRTREAMAGAVERAREHCPEVLIEEFVEGQDLRIVVIGNEVVAAAIRKPAQVTGTGRHTVRQLIDKQSRRRAAATGGESRIPLDAETERCVRDAGFALDDVPPRGTVVVVRKSANLHTGGTIHDVTDRLNPALANAAVRAAGVLEIPVVGLDFLADDPESGDYVVIEANERPGLANHEPQPTAQRFVDLLFPDTARAVEPRTGW